MADTLRVFTYPFPDFDRLLAQFASAECLPNMPAAALNLCEAIDQGEASAAELERIVLGDPAITAGVLKAANSAHFGKSNQASTIRGAILVLGHRAVRSVGVSVWVQALIHSAKGSPKFDAHRFSEHSMFVGFLSKYLLSAVRKSEGVQSEWSPDEIFAAGVLHDVGLGLLASTEPVAYNMLFDTASAEGVGFDPVFERFTGHKLGELSVAAAKGWRLPTLFADVLAGFENPLEALAEQDALCCMNYANALAEAHGHGIPSWPLEVVPDPAVVDRIGLTPEELEEVLELTARHTQEYVAAA